jgi:hypothetical protein
VGQKPQKACPGAICAMEAREKRKKLRDGSSLGLSFRLGKACTCTARGRHVFLPSVQAKVCRMGNLSHWHQNVYNIRKMLILSVGLVKCDLMRHYWYLDSALSQA